MDWFCRGALRFEVTEAGPAGGEAVILLHGFPADRNCWDATLPRLAGAGYRALAFDQRGYSPGARPSGRRAYTLAELETDVLAAADSAGCPRFHLVGHDWGAVVAWAVAGRHPDRVASVTALSVPHPAAMVAALGRGQLRRSWYIGAFNVPAVPEVVLTWGGGRLLRAALTRTGLGAEVAGCYARRASQPGALTGALNWYRALPLQSVARVPPCPVPTLLVWSDGDTAVTRAAAEGCAAHVSGPYRFEVLEGVSHWIPEEAPEAATDLLLAHLSASAAR